MKVLHFYKTYLPHSIGGVEKVIDEIAKGSIKYGVVSEVLVLSPQKSYSCSIINGYKVHYIPQLFSIASTPFSFKILQKFRYLANEADIIHYHFPFPIADLVHFITRIRKPSIVTYHSDIVKQKLLLQLYKPLMFRFLKSVSCIVATSPNYVKTSRVLSNFIHKVKIIPLGIEKNFYPNCDIEQLNYWRNKLPQQFFLFIGVARYYKGLGYLINAIKNVKAGIVIISRKNKLTEKLQKLVNDLNISNVYFLGELGEKDKVALLSLCYGFVLPSHLRSEAFGIALLEAAMFAKPLISCEIGTGTSFINQHNVTGLVVEPSNHNALSEAMNYLLQHPAQAKFFAQNAQKRYEKLFTATQMVKNYVELYKQVLNLK